LQQRVPLGPDDFFGFFPGDIVLEDKKTK